jgi:hypothetical protein
MQEILSDARSVISVKLLFDGSDPEDARRILDVPLQTFVNPLISAFGV